MRNLARIVRIISGVGIFRAEIDNRMSCGCQLPVKLIFEFISGVVCAKGDSHKKLYFSELLADDTVLNCVIAIPLLLNLFAADPPVVRPDGSRVSSDQITQRMEQAVAQAKIAGIGVSILQNGHVRYLKTFGYADAATKRPLTPETVMYGASFTKAMFGYTVTRLAEEGKIDLARPIATYLKKPLPEYPKYADLDTELRCKQITPRILLSHTAGFANFAFLEPDRKMRLHFDPGTRYAYSGEGINLLHSF